jgi:iron(III) transport system substrate-binding protein
MFRSLLFFLFILSVSFGFDGRKECLAGESEVNVYSHRQPFLINPFLKEFTKETGIKTNILYSKTGLAARIQAEGENTPADVVLTVDIARLMSYANKKLLAQIDSEILFLNIPKHLRASDNTWFAFSKRARVVAIARGRVEPSELERIEDLTAKKWKGRICSRPGSHVYNRSLLASIINANGAAAAEKWAEGLVANLARRPQGNDRAQIKAIHSGECDLSIVNNYYYGKLLSSKVANQRDWAKSVRLVFMNQNGRGNHVNISGGGVVKHSKNKENAIKLIEFLTGEFAQKLYGKINYEYPVNPNVGLSNALSTWGVFKEDTVSIEKIADLARESQKIIDRSGW